MALKRHGFVRRRRAVGLTQEDLAAELRVERSTVGRWEAGTSTPYPYMWPRLAEVLEISRGQLSDLLAVRPEEERIGPSVEHALRHPSAVDLLAVAELRTEIGILTERYDRTPSAALLAQAGQYLSQVELLAGEARTGRVQRELRMLQSEAATFMGQLVWDASQRRDHATARSYYGQGMEVAQHLRDAAAEGHALLRTCHVALYGASDHREGLELALRAARKTRSTSRVLTGLAMLHAAEAHAYLGDSRDCGQALRRAERLLEQADATDIAREMYSPTHFGRLAGSCYLSLGNYSKARQHLSETAAELLDRHKSRTIVLGNLALAAIREDDLDAALDAFNTALNELHGTRGGGGMNVVFRAARELRPWRAEPAVLEAQDRLMALMEAS